MFYPALPYSPPLHVVTVGLQEAVKHVQDQRLVTGWELVLLGDDRGPDKVGCQDAARPLAGADRRRRLEDLRSWLLPFLIKNSPHRSTRC